MRRTLPLLLLHPLLLAGCMMQDVRTGEVAPSESAARFPLRDRMASVIGKKLGGDGWVGTITDKAYTGGLSPNPDELWSEDRFTFVVTTAATDGSPFHVSADDYPALLRELRRALRNVVEEFGGEQVDWTLGEAFHERTLDFRYNAGGVAGMVLVRITPKTDEPDDAVLKVEVTVREQAAQ